MTDSGVDLDWEVHPSRVIDNPTCLTLDEVGRLHDHVDISITHVETLEEQLDVTTTHDELQVTLDLDAGHIVGDIDHLTVTKDCYYVTDYKIDSLDRRDVDDLAAHYWPQLHVYACELQQASPKDAVVFGLLCSLTATSYGQRLSALTRLNGTRAIQRYPRGGERATLNLFNDSRLRLGRSGVLDPVREEYIE